MSSDRPPRIISLIASATEIVCALGAREQLVGISHECDFPPDVESLPICSYAKLRTDVPSKDIDSQVKTLLADAVSIYGLHTETIDAQEPTHLVTQSQCDVCAVSLSDVQAAVCDTLASSPEVVVCEPNSLSDVWDDIRRVGNAIGRSAEADNLIAGAIRTLESLANDIERSQRPKVACIEWTEPLMAAGNWVPELVELAGGTSVTGQVGVHSPWLTFEELAEADPDIVVVLPCGFDLNRTIEESAKMLVQHDWQTIRAFRDRKVFAVDGNAYFNRPGPRLVDSAELLYELFFNTGPTAMGDGIRWSRLVD